MWFAKRKALPIRSLIGEGAVLHGNLSFADGLRIDGEVHGNVIATTPTSLLVISEKARVLGEVKGGHVIINGEVRGPVHASDLLELQPKAQVSGNVRYELLEMHQGAIISGQLRPLNEDATDTPLLKLATKV